MLKRALQQVEQASASCIASTSRAVHTATRKANSPGSPPSGQKRQQYLKKVKEKHALSLQIQELTKPDPYLGHQDNKEGHKYWQSSELCKIILSKDAVWGVREDRRGNLIKIDASTAVNVDGAGEDSDGENDEFSNGPERMNFGLDTVEDRRMLFSDLPLISQQDLMRHRQDPSMTDEKLILEIEDKQWKGQNGVNILSRVLDLKNASGKGIQVENTRRIIDYFGRREKGDLRGPDTGSVEVQSEKCRTQRRKRACLLTGLPLLISGRLNLSDTQLA